MRESWDRRIQRAEQLAAGEHPAGSLLRFYARVLSGQRSLYDVLNGQRDRRLAGSLPEDLIAIRKPARSLLKDVAASGPDQLAAEARQLLDGSDQALDDLLLAYWQTPSDRQFFAKAVLQPYAQWLRDNGAGPIRPDRARTDSSCRFCGGVPQLSILQAPLESPAESGGRTLQCATCLAVWPFRRVLCPSCGEEDERKLGYFQSPIFDHLRLDVCDTCHHYMKSVDLTRLGFAVPIVDELAGASLDLWAGEHGYRKIELNLVGL